MAEPDADKVTNYDTVENEMFNLINVQKDIDEK